MWNICAAESTSAMAYPFPDEATTIIQAIYQDPNGDEDDEDEEDENKGTASHNDNPGEEDEEDEDEENGPVGPLWSVRAGVS